MCDIMDLSSLTGSSFSLLIRFYIIMMSGHVPLSWLSHEEVAQDS